MHTFARAVIIADTSRKASLLITDSVAGLEVALLVRCWSKTDTLDEALLHSEASRAILTMTARIITDSANGTFALTSRETCFKVAVDEAAGGGFLMGVDDDVDITSIKGYSSKVSLSKIRISFIVRRSERTILGFGSWHCCYTGSDSHSGPCNEFAERRHRW